MSDAAPVRPGAQLGLMVVTFQNVSHSPLTIDSVTIPGRGVGSVIRIIEVRIAVGAGRHVLPGGGYFTDPPVLWTGRGTECTYQALQPVHGYQLAAGAVAKLWVVVQAERPGSFSNHAHIIDYTQDGTRYQQAVPTGFDGSVAVKAPIIPLGWPPQQWQCVRRTGATMLAPYTLPGGS